MPRSVFVDRTIKAVETHFSVRPIELEAVETNLNPEFAHSTRLLTDEELVAATFESHFEKSLSHSL